MERSDAWQGGVYFTNVAVSKLIVILKLWYSHQDSGGLLVARAIVVGRKL